MRIRLRLALFGAIVVASTMLAFGILIGLLARASAPQDQDEALAELVETVVTDLQTAVAGDLVPVEPPVRVDVATSTEPFIVILDASGLPLYSTGELAGEPPAIPAAIVVEATQTGESQATLRPVDQVEFRVHARPWDRPDLGQSGVAIAGQSTAFINEQLRGLSALLWITGIVLTIVAVGVGWLVAGRALRPLRELAATTEEIRRTGDLTSRLPAARNQKDEVGVLTDSFNRMLESLQESQGRLSDSLAAQRRFVADASHELRSPLTTVRNNAEFLSRHPEAADLDRGEALADIVAEGERMSALISDLLTLAQSDASAGDQMRPFDFTTMVREVARRYERARVEAAADLVVHGSPDGLRRVVVILLDNAAKHGAGEILATIKESETSAVLQVSDDGPGIAPEELERVFDRFYQADPARGAEGFGLGLAIAKQIVTAHQGTIAASNRSEGGAVFEVRLPLDS